MYIFFIVFSYIPYNSIKLVVICYSKCSYLSLYFLSQSKDLTILIFPKNQLLWDFFPLNVLCTLCYPFPCCSRCSLSLTFGSLVIIDLSLGLFGFITLEVHWASCICIFISSLRFQKLLGFFFLNHYFLYKLTLFLTSPLELP